MNLIRHYNTCSCDVEVTPHITAKNNKPPLRTIVSIAFDFIILTPESPITKRRQHLKKAGSQDTTLGINCQGSNPPKQGDCMKIRERQRATT
jgi:hypothetical protein